MEEEKDKPKEVKGGSGCFVVEIEWE